MEKSSKWGWIIFLIFLLPIIGYALTPPIQSDGIRYHLAALQEYLKADGLVYLPFNAFTNMPFLVEMIFLLPMGLGSDTTAQLVHLSFLVISAEIVFRMLGDHVEGFQFIISRSFTAWFIRALFLGMPVAVIVSTWPFIDAALMAFFLAMLLMLFRWLRDPSETRHLHWCGFFAGACLASKYTMVVFAGLIVMIVVIRYIQIKNDLKINFAAKHFLLFLAVIFIVAAPWYAKNMIHTGNPVYPLANGIFQGGEWGEVSAHLYSAKAGAKGSKTILGFMAGPVLSTISWTPIPDNPAWFARLNYEDQNPGMLFLMTLPLVLGAAIALLRRDRKRLARWCYPPYLIVAVSVVFYMFWFFTYQSNRFMLPLFALSIFGVIFAIDYFSLRRRFYSFLAVFFLILISILYGYTWSLEWMFARTRVTPLPYLLGYQSREDYITEALPHTQNFRVLEGLVATGEKTLFVGEYRGYYCKVPYVANDFFDQPVMLEYLRRAHLDLGHLRQGLLDDDIRYVFLNWAELKLYQNDFRLFFSPDEWRAFENFLNAPWLVKASEISPGFIIYKIAPD